MPRMFAISRVQLIAKGIKFLMQYSPNLTDTATGGKVLNFRGKSLVFVQTLPEKLEESFSFEINPELELSWIGTHAEEFDEATVYMLRNGWINLEKIRFFLLRNLTMIAVGKTLGRENEVKQSISRLLMEQMDKSLTEKVEFARIAYQAQLAGDLMSELKIAPEILENFDSIKKLYGSRHFEHQLIERVFATEPEVFLEAMLAEEEGKLTGTNVSFRALCDAATNIQSVIFPGLTLAEYRAVLIKLRYPMQSIIERWSAIATDGVRLVDRGSDENRLPMPGEVIGIDLKKLRRQDIILCDTVENLRDHILLNCASEDLRNNNMVFLGKERSLDLPERLIDAAETEIRQVFKPLEPRDETVRIRKLHPRTIQKPSKSELEKMKENAPSWATIAEPTGGLCEERYTGPMDFEGRGGKYSIVCEEGKYFVRSRRRSVMSWAFQTELLLGPIGRFGVKREKYQPGEELTIPAVVNTLMSKVGKDATKYQRHAMLLAKEHELFGDNGSSCMFPKAVEGSSCNECNLLGVFHKCFVKEVDCVMEKEGDKIYMLIRGRPVLIVRENSTLLTLKEHVGDFMRSRHRRIQLDIGNMSIGTLSH